MTKELLAKELKVTINSDDPAYFGGYLSDNFLDTALDLGFNEDNVSRFVSMPLLPPFFHHKTKKCT